MKLKDFIEYAKKGRKGEEIWISNENFNRFVKEADEIRINEQGYLVLKYKNIKIQISLKNKYLENCFAEVKEIAEYEVYNNVFTKKKKVIFTYPVITKNYL